MYTRDFGETEAHLPPGYSGSVYRADSPLPVTEEREGDVPIPREETAPASTEPVKRERGTIAGWLSRVGIHTGSFSLDIDDILLLAIALLLLFEDGESDMLPLLFFLAVFLK